MLYRNDVKHYLFRLAIHKASYVLCAFFVCFCLMQFAAFGSLHRFFTAMPYVCIVIVPALVSIIPFSRQDYALPYTDARIVFFKSLAVFSVMLLALLCTAVMPFVFCLRKAVELPYLFCAYGGIVLYLVVAVSLCLFLFTVIGHAGIAFAVSSALLALASNVHAIASSVRLPVFFLALCKSLSFVWHFDAAGKGIVDTRDVVFYLVCALLFFFAAVAARECRRGYASPLFRKFCVLVFIGMILLLSVSSKFYLRIDVTREKFFSVQLYTKEVLAHIEEPLFITYYRSTVLKSLYPQVRDVEEFLQDYASQNAYVSCRVIDPVKEQLESKLASYGIYGRQIQSYSAMYSAVVLNYLGRVKVVPLVLGTGTLEYDVTRCVLQLLQKSESLVQVAVGSGLSLQDDYAYIQPWLESQGFEIRQSYLPSQKESVAGQELFSLHADVPLLLLGTYDFTREDAEALSYFIERGGKLFLASTPYLVNMDDWSVIERNAFSKDYIGYLLQDYGVYYRDGIVASEQGRTLSLGGTQELSYPLWPELESQRYAQNGITLFWPSAIELDSELAAQKGFAVSPLLSTNSASWLCSRGGGEGNSFITNPFTVSPHAEEGDEMGSFTVAAALRPVSKDSPSLIILGDQYALHSAFLSSDVRTLEFLSDGLMALLGHAELLSLKRHSAQNMQALQPSAKLLAVCIILPLLLLAALAASVTVWRKRFNSQGL